jgi:hypothetical protein
VLYNALATHHRGEQHCFLIHFLIRSLIRLYIVDVAVNLAFFFLWCAVLALVVRNGVNVLPLVLALVLAHVCGTPSCQHFSLLQLIVTLVSLVVRNGVNVLPLVLALVLAHVRGTPSCQHFSLLQLIVTLVL